MMKLKTCLLTLFTCLFFVAANAQKTRSDIFSDDQMVFFGLDFSEAKMIGSLGFTNPDDIVERIIYNWNRLTFNERDKYDLKKGFQKTGVDYDFSVVDKRNETINPRELVIDEAYQIEKEQLLDIISQYESEKNQEGLGLVFVVESFNKSEDLGYMWVTFFDIETKKVLMARRMNGKTGGFGLRNYWARTVLNVINKSAKAMKRWEKE